MTAKPPLKMMHLLIGGGMGGAEMFYLRLGRALQKRGHEQFMVLTEDPFRQDFLQTNGLRHEIVRRSGIARLFLKQRLASITKRERPDVVVAWMNAAGRHIPQGRHLTVGRIGNFYDLDHYRRCDLIVANSPELQSHAAASGRPDAVTIPNFIELTSSDTKDVVPHSGRPAILCVGRLNPKKNFDILIRAVAGTDAELWIAGVGHERQNLEDLAQTLGIEDRVRFLGWRDDIGTLLAKADMFALCSVVEGTSNAILEAAAFGKPIIASSGPSVSWFLEHGESAEIVSPGDVEQTRQAINRLCSDPSYATRLGRRAQHVYQTQFSEDIVCDRWVDVMHDALDKKRSK